MQKAFSKISSRIYELIEYSNVPLLAIAIERHMQVYRHVYHGLLILNLFCLHLCLTCVIYLFIYYMVCTRVKSSGVTAKNRKRGKSRVTAGKRDHTEEI